MAVWTPTGCVTWRFPAIVANQRKPPPLTSLPLPRFDGRIVLAVVVSPWLRSDAACSPERLFCHVHGRSRAAAQIIPRLAVLDRRRPFAGP